MMSFSQMQSQMQSQGIALPPEVKVGPSASCVNTKKSYVDSSRQDSETWDSNKRGLYADDSPPRLVVVGRVYKGSMTVHNIVFRQNDDHLPMCNALEDIKLL